MNGKKWIFLVALVLVVGLIAAPVNADSKDYKVIKRGVKKSVGEPTMLKLKVIDKATKKQEVNLSMPVALLEWASECCKDEKVRVSGTCSLSLKEMLRILRKSGNNVLLEVEAEEKLVKIWVE